jgi:serine protease inhibitor
VIPSILSGPPSSLGLVALNAMYFKSLWREPFSKQATRPQPFHLLDQTKVEVPMMYRTLRARYRESNRFVGIELEYKSDRFAMIVITSRDGPRPARDFAGVADWLDGAEFSDGIVELSLPRFKVDEKAELLKGLVAMGLSNHPPAFERLVQQPQEMVSISQKTFLAVDEEGTEAAAVTAVHSATRSSRPKVTVDNPFVFALRDRSSGLILLSGYIGRPASGQTASLAR